MPLATLLPTKNPFSLKNYVVYESAVSTSCSSDSLSSIVDITTGSVAPTGFTESTPMNLIEVENYISNEINKFLIKVKLVKTCDNYTVQKYTLPASCAATFTNYPATQPQLGTGSTILNSIQYTPAYLSTHPDEKSLCQRLADLQNMIKNFQSFLDAIPKTSEYADQYEYIMKKYKENLNMRDLLEQKLDNIYSTESSYSNSKRYLDATIYTSVLWTILATTFVFYIFKKM